MGKITTQVVRNIADFLTTHKVQDGILLKSDDNPLTIANVKSRINLWLAEQGAENPEGTIFSIGRDAGIPHSSGNPDDLLHLGQTIIFDIFPCEAGGGYYYDFTRTWCLGYAPDEVQAVYEDVLKVFQQVRSELKVNTPCRDYQVRTCELFESLGHPTVKGNPQTEIGYVHGLGQILRVISSSPQDLGPVFETILASGTQLCEAQLGIVFTYDSDAFRAVAHRGLSAEAVAHYEAPIRPGPLSGLGRMLAQRRAVHVTDVLDDPAYVAGDALRQATVQLLGARTVLFVPIIQEAAPLGALVIYRQEVRPFTDEQIGLVETFDHQAGIAIENARLFKELQARNAALTLPDPDAHFVPPFSVFPLAVLLSETARAARPC